MRGCLQFHQVFEARFHPLHRNQIFDKFNLAMFSLLINAKNSKIYLSLSAIKQRSIRSNQSTTPEEEKVREAAKVPNPQRSFAGSSFLGRGRGEESRDGMKRDGMKKDGRHSEGKTKVR